MSCITRFSLTGLFVVLTGCRLNFELMEISDGNDGDIGDAGAIGPDAAFVVPTEAFCDEDNSFHLANGHCYVPHNTPQSYARARQICHSSGAELVSPSSLEEATAIDTSLSLTGEYWLGLSTTPALWEWQTGEPLLFDKWAGGEPVSPPVVAFAFTAVGGEWNTTVDGETFRAFVCEYSSLSTPEALYQMYTQELPNPLARASCVLHGGSLATTSKMNEQIILSQAFPGSTYWIGVSDRENEGSWVWESGESLGDNQWRDGHPLQTVGYDCAYALDGEWTSQLCEDALPYICKFTQGG